jgi:hypothetical protein
MKYFKAFAIAEKPLINWMEWAKDITELTEMGEFENPLIVAENVIPAQIYGVCPWKIVSGELVELTAPEMEAFEEEFLLAEKISEFQAKTNDVNAGSFLYSGKYFPMHEASRLFYYAIKEQLGDHTVMTVDGEEFSLVEANIDAFYFEYTKQLLNYTKPY